MLIVISPAKTLAPAPTSPAAAANAPTVKYTTPDFLGEASQLIAHLRGFSASEIGTMMAISPALAALNAARYAAWDARHDAANARPAVLTFDGDVYGGLDAPSLSSAQHDYVQSHLRILSGLYGVLRPFDLMQAYRLEMGTALANRRGRNLYAYWGGQITAALNAAVAGGGAAALVNLASEEYFRVVQPAELAVPVLTPVFEDWKNGRYKVISFFAKRARGLMVRYAAQHGLERAEQLKHFDVDGYAFDAAHSSERRWLFRRRLEA